MPAGLNAMMTKNGIDQVIGQVAQDLNKAFISIEETKRFVDSTQDADLAALGYTPGDIANIRSAYGDLEQLRTIYEGAATLGAAKDFRAFAQRIYGTGFSAPS